MPHIKCNVGMVFTNGDLKEMRDVVVSNKIAASAKVGAVSQCTVTIPGGNTGISPDKTSFFQALGISTKVVKGAIEILTDVTLLRQGDRVGASEAELLTMLGIMPFSYGCVVRLVYDNGSVFEPSMLDITDETIMGFYNAGLQRVAALSMAIGFPAMASVPHLLANGFKNLLAVSLASDYSFPASEKLKETLANPAALAAAASAVQARIQTASPAAVVEEKKDESDEEMGFSLFD